MLETYFLQNTNLHEFTLSGHEPFPVMARIMTLCEFGTALYTGLGTLLHATYI